MTEVMKVSDTQESVEKKIVANFFWHGPLLTLYEIACLRSFVYHEFDVQLYTFNLTQKVPTGVTIKDARRFSTPDETLKYTQSGAKNSISAFADVFRYRLLSAEGGWWFDTDVLCLRDSKDFLKLQMTSSGLVSARESTDRIFNTIMYVSDLSVAEELSDEAMKKGTNFQWGTLGPKLVSEYYTRYPQKITLLPVTTFYPVLLNELDYFYDPALKKQCEERSANSYCTHLWNEIIKRSSISKNVLPCKGSYLEKYFLLYGDCNDKMDYLKFEKYQDLRKSSGSPLFGKNLKYKLIVYPLKKLIRCVKSFFGCIYK